MWTPPKEDEIVTAPAQSGWQPPENDEVVPTGNEKSLGGFASNAVSDAGEIVSGVASLAGNLATHPIDTAVQTVKGIPTAVKMLAKEWGIPEAMEGRFHDALKQIGESAYQHPVSRALDVASVAVPALKGAGVIKGVEGAELANQAGKLGKAAELSADSRWAKSIGGTLKDSRELGAEEFRRLGRKAATEKIVTPLNSTESMIEKSEGLLEGHGKDLGDIRAKGEMFGDAPEGQKLMQHIEQELGPKYKEGVYQPESGAFNNAKSEVQKLSPIDKLTPSEELQGALKKATREGDHTSDPMGVFNHKGATLPQDEYESFRAAQESPDYIPEYDIRRPTTFQEVAKTSQDLNKFARGQTKLLQPATAETDVANLISKLNDEKLLSVLPEAEGAKYTKGLGEFSDLKKIEKMLDNKNDFEAGGSRNGITNNISNKLLHKFGYQLSAAGMDKIAGFLKTNPEKFGKYANVLNGAMSAGPAALATTVDLLAQNDPEFAKQMEGMQ